MIPAERDASSRAGGSPQAAGGRVDGVLTGVRQPNDDVPDEEPYSDQPVFGSLVKVGHLVERRRRWSSAANASETGSSPRPANTAAGKAEAGIPVQSGVWELECASAPANA